MEATLKKGMDKTELFHFIHFLPFQSGRPSKWLKHVNNVKKSNFGHNLRLRNKSHKIKKNCHLFLGHMELFNFIYYIQFSKKNLKHGRNAPKKGQNSTCFTFGGQNLTLRNKSHEIKKFPHILCNFLFFLIFFLYSQEVL